MAERVTVTPALLNWARQRAGMSRADLAKFPLADWESGDLAPTFKQLMAFAKATHTPIGYLFLTQPPAERLPIPDFRTMTNQAVGSASPDLLDVIYTCEQRQDWYRAFAEAHAFDAVPFVGSHDLGDAPEQAAADLRDMLGFGLAQRAEFSNWSLALTGLISHAEDAGVLVMVSGVVGSNTHRKLNPDEFRGFALADPLAPTVFVNGADSKAAQIFTLAHELAHIALGGSAVSSPDLGTLDDADQTERWCNRVAAELLVPADSLREDFERDAELTAELERLAKVYRVSTLVVLRRLADTSLMSRAAFRVAFPEERSRIMALSAERASGGDFYNTTPVRVSKRFAKALIADTVEGRTSYRDAFRLLGSKKQAAFDELGQRLGVA